MMERFSVFLKAKLWEFRYEKTLKNIIPSTETIILFGSIR